MSRLCTRLLGMLLIGCYLTGCTVPSFLECHDIDFFEGLFSLNTSGMLAAESEVSPFAVEPSRRYAWIHEAPSVVGVSSSQGTMVWSFELDGKTYHAEYVRVE